MGTSTQNEGRYAVTSEILDRTPPCDLEAERSLLSCFILQPTLMHEVNGLAPKDFFDESHQAVFAAMLGLKAHGQPVDATTLVNALKEAGRLEEIGGPYGICELARAAPVVGNWKSYLAIVERASEARSLLIALTGALKHLYEGRPLDGIKKYLTKSIQPIETAEPQSPIIVQLADIQPKKIRWLWPGRIAIGKLTLVAGDPGLGKSLVGLDVAARVSLGAKWPDCDSHAPLGTAVLMSAEDDLEDTVRPRLDSAGADVKRIIALQGVRAHDQDGKYERAIDLQRDLPIIEQTITAQHDCKLVVLDPISAFLGSVDSHNNSEVRGVLAPLSELAAKFGVAVLAITHLRKSDGAAVYRSMGSLAFTAAARAVWAVIQDKADEDRRLFLQVKNNLAKMQFGLAYRVTSRYTDQDEPCVGWESQPVSITADEALAPRRPGPDADERGEAVEFLRYVLANGPRLTKEVEDEADARGISKSTLKRARRELGVQAIRETIPGPWALRLPQQDQDDF